VRIVLQFAPDAATDQISARFPDVDIVRYSGSEPPPIKADVFVGGYVDWVGVERWLDEMHIPWMQLAGTGIDSVPAAIFAGRTVTCARGASAAAIAEWVMAALLSRAKRFPEAFVTQPPARWNFPTLPLDSIEGSTLGIIGLGGIGSRIAHHAVMFGMKVKALRRTADPPSVAGVRLVGALPDLLGDADHLVLAAPATPRTRHLIDAGAFRLMKPGVHLVNVARGSLVDQDALHQALDEGTVAMATLDAVQPEPLPEGHWMYSHAKVRLSPHGSWYTPSAHEAMLEIILANLERFLAHEPLLGVVDLDEGY
jgi:phosphoglycerate dehydrogenase-like enzyme